MTAFTDPLAIATGAFKAGFTPVPLRPKTKRPFTEDWQHKTFDSEREVADHFTTLQIDFEDTLNVGINLGGEHGGTVDIDVDNPKASLIASGLLPHTDMRSGRDTNPDSHFWYKLAEPFEQGTKAFKLPDDSVIIEYRADGGQTVAPGSIHDKTGERYVWEGEAWGGSKGAARVSGQKLLASTAAIAMLVLLADNWPGPGSRHGAYLALVGGMLRDWDEDGRPMCHSGWDSSIESMIKILAQLTHDGDGAGTRIAESVKTTRAAIIKGKKVQGWPTLAKIIGDDYVEKIRECVLLIETLDGRPRGQRPADSDPGSSTDETSQTSEPASSGSDATFEGETFDERFARLADLPVEDRDPMAERTSAWEELALAPYLMGDLEPIQPTCLLRTDGQPLFYKGRINSLYGSGGSGKTWIALLAVIQEIKAGGRALMVDFEDEPQGTLGRLRALRVDEAAVLDGAFSYVAPDEPIASMQTDRYGQPSPSASGARHKGVFDDLLKRNDPSLIIIDGITTLYSLHGLNTNDAGSTDIMSRWLRSLTNNYQRTVILIDHTAKTAAPGSSPMGSQHKIAMIQGTALQVVSTKRPRPGGVGEATLYVGKDRPGGVIAHATDADPAICGQVSFTSSATGGRMRIEIDPGEEGDFVVDIDPSAVKKADKVRKESKFKTPESPVTPRQGSTRTSTPGRSKKPADASTASGKGTTRSPGRPGRTPEDWKTIENSVLNALKSGPKSAVEIKFATRAGRDAAQRATTNLINAGMVEATGKGPNTRYSQTTEPEETP